jgi:serine/threonine protein kinase
MEDTRTHCIHLSPGTRLNETYRIDSLIGSGGMGEIYRGCAIHTGDTVAIKLIRRDFEDNEVALSLFQREASALNRLYHEAIVRYYVLSIDPVIGRHYLAMEFVDGPSLAELLKRGPLDYEVVRALRRRIATGLQAAHERGIVHRDVSPDNIIVPDGDVALAKIIDFGIARSTRRGDTTIIGSGFAGKLNYVSPEQLGLAGGVATAKSDIYSLGLVLAEALTGRPIDMGGSEAAVVDKRRAVPDLGAIDPRIRPLIAGMLDPDPARRPDSMAAVAAWSEAETPPPGASARVAVSGLRLQEEAAAERRRRTRGLIAALNAERPMPGPAPLMELEPSHFEPVDAMAPSGVVAVLDQQSQPPAVEPAGSDEAIHYPLLTADAALDESAIAVLDEPIAREVGIAAPDRTSDDAGNQLDAALDRGDGQASDALREIRRPRQPKTDTVVVSPAAPEAETAEPELIADEIHHQEMQETMVREPATVPDTEERDALYLKPPGLPNEDGQAQLAPGTRLNDVYEIDRPLNWPGKDEVYRAHSIGTDVQVAIQLIDMAIDRDSVALNVLDAEILALRHLHHDAIACCYGLHFDPTIRRHYVATELVDGPSLAEMLERGPLDFEAVQVLRRRLAAGLNAAHECGLIHRRLSPHNIIVPHGVVNYAKIVNFNLAHTSDKGVVIRSSAAAKLNYMAPEQFGLTGGQATARSDIYCLGLILAAALLGQPIYISGRASDVSDRSRRMPTLEVIDSRLRPLVARMLDPNPAARPDSMAVAAWSAPVAVPAVLEPRARAEPLRVGKSPWSWLGAIAAVAGMGLVVVALRYAFTPAAPLAAPPAPEISQAPMPPRAPGIEAPAPPAAELQTAAVPPDPASASPTEEWRGPNGELRLKPTFDCAPSGLTPLEQLICASPALTRVDLEHAQAFYALWQQIANESGPTDLHESVGKKAIYTGQIDLFHEENTRLKTIIISCNIPISGTLPTESDEVEICFINAYRSEEADWTSRLHGAALTEAQRPLDLHVTLQAALKRLGFLPASEHVDGVYGDATRSAIKAWQKQHRLAETGFLEADQALALQREAQL